MIDGCWMQPGKIIKQQNPDRDWIFVTKCSSTMKIPLGMKQEQK
jgi:hypothetical protein